MIRVFVLGTATGVLLVAAGITMMIHVAWKEVNG